MTRPKRGVGVRWGRQELVFQRGGNVATGFLMQASAVVMMVLLMSTQAEALPKRSQSAKAEFKQQHPCPAAGSTNRPCKGYVIDHIVLIACRGADEPSNMQGRPSRMPKGNARGAGSEPVAHRPVVNQMVG